MTDHNDPTGAAAIWRNAADKVIELKRDDLSGDALEAWNAALERASQALAKEADDIRQMAIMAHLLIVGNVHASSRGGRDGSAQ
jgi:hypothetical protein